jgi:hypothetical protein
MPDLIPILELSKDRVLEIINRGSDGTHSFSSKIIGGSSNTIYPSTASKIIGSGTSILSAAQNLGNSLNNLGKSVAGGSGGTYPSSTRIKVTPKPMISKVELVGDKYVITMDRDYVMSYLTIIKLSMAVRLEDLPVISDSSQMFNEIAKARLEYVKMDFYNTFIDLKTS